MATPTKASLRSLPRWALVAFAARCARRVEPLFLRAWPDAPLFCWVAVAEAVRCAEECAATARATVSYAKGCAFQADLAAQCADGEPDEVSQSGAYEAAHAAANAVSTIAYMGDEDVALGAVYAAHDAARALFIVLGLGSQPILDDFEHLKASAEMHGWTDETPVPPEFFAPLQPFGEDEEVRREAYDAWERAGRPSLSPQEQGRMYYEALHRVRAARRRAAPSGP